MCRNWRSVFHWPPIAPKPRFPLNSWKHLTLSLQLNLASCSRKQPFWKIIQSKIWTQSIQNSVTLTRSFSSLKHLPFSLLPRLYRMKEKSHLIPWIQGSPNLLSETSVDSAQFTAVQMVPSKGVTACQGPYWKRSDVHSLSWLQNSCGLSAGPVLCLSSWDIHRIFPSASL